VFSEVLATARERLEAGKAVLLQVDVQRQGEELRLTCQEVRPLEEVVATVAEGLRILVRDPSPLPLLKATLDQLPRGRARISIAVEIAAFREVDIALPGSYAMSPRTRSTLRSVSGVVDVVDL